MSVYPEKRNGKPTGKWIAEVWADGTLYQHCAASREAAAVKEKELRKGKKEAPLGHNVVQLKGLRKSAAKATGADDYSVESMIARGLVCHRFWEHVPPYRKRSRVMKKKNGKTKNGK
jgi:hypothetical protein